MLDAQTKLEARILAKKSSDMTGWTGTASSAAAGGVKNKKKDAILDNSSMDVDYGYGILKEESSSYLQS